MIVKLELRKGTTTAEKDANNFIVFFCFFCYYYFFFTSGVSFNLFPTQLDYRLHDQADNSFMTDIFSDAHGKFICVFVCLDYKENHVYSDMLVFCDSS